MGKAIRSQPYCHTSRTKRNQEGSCVRMSMIRELHREHRLQTNMTTHHVVRETRDEYAHHGEYKRVNVSDSNTLCLHIVFNTPRKLTSNAFWRRWSFLLRHQSKAHIVMNLEQVHFPFPREAAKNSAGGRLCRERYRVEIVRKKVVTKETGLTRLFSEAGKLGKCHQVRVEHDYKLLVVPTRVMHAFDSFNMGRISMSIAGGNQNRYSGLEAVRRDVIQNMDIDKCTQ